MYQVIYKTKAIKQLKKIQREQAHKSVRNAVGYPLSPIAKI